MAGHVVKNLYLQAERFHPWLQQILVIGVLGDFAVRCLAQAKLVIRNLLERSKFFTYNQELEKGFAKCVHNMVDFVIQLVGTGERAPSCKNGVGDFKNTNVDLWVGCAETTDEFLWRDRC